MRRRAFSGEYLKSTRKCVRNEIQLYFLQNYPDSKVIIFCEYRESVFLINRMLIEESPRVKPKVFVGKYLMQIQAHS